MVIGVDGENKVFHFFYFERALFVRIIPITLSAMPILASTGSNTGSSHFVVVLHCAVKAVVLFDNGVKAALVVAACAFLMLKTGFLECGFLIYYPLVVVLGVVGRNILASLELFAAELAVGVPV